MAGVVVPNFAASIGAPIQPGPSPWAVAASSLMETVGGITAQIQANKQAKKTALGFADAIESSDPQAAAMYRAMANNMPLYDPTAGGSGSGSGGSSGGGGGGLSPMMSNMMKDMFDQLKTTRDTNASKIMENLRFQNNISETAFRGQQERMTNAEHDAAMRRLENLRTQNEKTLAEATREWEIDKTNPKNIKQRDDALAESRRLDLEEKKYNLEVRKEDGRMLGRFMGVPATGGRARAAGPQGNAGSTAPKYGVVSYENANKSLDEINKKIEDKTATPFDLENKSALERLISNQLKSALHDPILTPEQEKAKAAAALLGGGSTAPSRPRNIPSHLLP